MPPKVKDTFLFAYAKPAHTTKIVKPINAPLKNPENTLLLTTKTSSKYKGENTLKTIKSAPKTTVKATHSKTISVVKASGFKVIRLSCANKPKGNMHMMIKNIKRINLKTGNK
eukprot:Opistho-1_new@97948